MTADYQNLSNTELNQVREAANAEAKRRQKVSDLLSNVRFAVQSALQNGVSPEVVQFEVAKTIGLSPDA